MKITDPKLLHELYEIEAERKLLIGYRFKGCLSAAREVNGRPARAKYRSAGKSKKRAGSAK
ncbi:MAG: hypothetical protein L0Z50_32135 [Verrucomicrobiales bacterium]|nr:hypothetical protein [Verrucomicrobiales bacterium]